MTYQEFKQQLCQTLQNELGSQVQVTVHDIIKNNNTHRDGLTMLSSRYNLSPTIYLESCYCDYKKGKSVSKICEEILQIYRKHQPAGNIDVSFFTDYDRIKSRIVFKLVNYERNETLLKDVPHFRFLDLAIVFNCLLECDFSGNATILIHKQHLSFWDITQDDLYALAMQNTPALLKYDLRNMSDILTELLSMSEQDEQLRSAAGPFTMYVLTNQRRLNGAVCILYKNLLKTISDKVNSDLYILPSSIHEVILLPAAANDSCEELSDMVRDVNRTQLSREEVLSDHVYFYCKETGQITM